MEAQSGSSSSASGEEEAVEDQRCVGTKLHRSLWRAHMRFAVDADGQPAVGRGTTKDLLSCNTQGEAAVTHDLSVIWLRGLVPAASRQQNAPAASYQRHCPAVLQQLGGIDTLPQLRLHLRQLRDDGVLASTGAALGLVSQEQPCPAAAAAGAAANTAGFQGIERAGTGRTAFRARLQLHMDSGGRPQQGAVGRKVDIVRSCPAPEAAAASDLGMLWRHHHAPWAMDQRRCDFSSDRCEHAAGRE